MIVISDTSPLIALAKIDCLSCLPRLFEAVVVPPEVHQELSAKSGEGIPDILRMAGDWLEVRSPKELLILGLDAGETAAISLALEKKSARLLIDERLGRRAATKLGLKVIGTVGILLEAGVEGMLNLGDSFERLKAIDFHFPHELLDDLLSDFNLHHNPNG